MRVVLGSGSPRRRDLLGSLGLTAKVIVPAIDETPDPGERPAELATRLAAHKADAVSARLATPAVVVAADTVVALDDVIFGQPDDERAARSMLGRLAGRTHDVHTAISVAGHTALVSARVTMAPMTAAEIRWYVATGEPLDKAGGYGIQGIGGAFVDRIDGSHSAVIGLPLVETIGLLRRCGVTVAGR